MKRLPLLIFLTLTLVGMEIREVKSLYMQTEKLRPFVVFDKGTYDLYAKLKLPNGKWFYVTPDGLYKDKIKYTHIDNDSSTYLFKDNTFVYENDKWLPQGRYTLHITLESNGAVVDAMDCSFSFLSHTITFPKYLIDKGVDNYKLLPSTDDTAWIVFDQHDASLETNEKDRLFAMKIDKDANVLIAPFEIARTFSDYSWSVAEEKNGGFFLFYNKHNEQYRYYRDVIGVYFDANGEKQVQKSIWQEFYGKSIDNPFERVVSAYTDMERNLSILFTFSSKNTLDMLLVHKGVKRISLGERGEKENFKACYDPKEGKIYVITDFGVSDRFVFYRYGVDGRLEVKKDVTSVLKDTMRVHFGYYEKQKELFATDKGIVFLYPKSGSVASVLFDRSGNVLKAKKIALPDLGMYINTDKYDIVQHNGLFWMVATSGPNMYLVSTDTDKALLFSALKPKGSYRSRPNIVELGNKIFVSVRSSVIEGNFLGNDKPLQEPDLAITQQNMVQKPYFARLGQDAQLAFDVFNVGEVNSTATTLTLEYMGTTYKKAIPVIEPGEKYELNISLPQPLYLTQMPSFSASIATKDSFNANNGFVGKIRFPSDTPIYPPYAKVYNWNVEDSVDGTPIDHVRVSYLYKNLQVVSGKRKDIRFVQRSDENGVFSTILEDGDYTFTLSKFGGEYPKTIITKHIPRGDDRFVLQAAGDLHIDFIQDDGSTLHPVPQHVAITMEHRYSADMPDWQKYRYTFKGNEKNAQIKRVMPGEYNLTIKAFGYEKKSVSGVRVESKTKTSYTVHLTPLPRGNICGKVVDANKKGVPDATVSLVNLPYYTTTESDGTFCLQDLAKSRTYTIELAKTDHLPFFYTFTLDETNLSVGALTLPKIDYKTIDLPKCRYAAWSQDLKWDDPKNSYEIKDLYGVWDMQGYLYYAEAQERSRARLLMLNLNVDGLLWMYYGLDGHVVKAIINWGLDVLGDVAEGAAEALGGTLKLVTKYVIQVKELKDFAEDLSDWANMPENYVAEYQNLSNPMGTVKGGVIDCGSLDVLGGLQKPTDSTPNRDKTVLRFDDIQIVENGSVIYSTYRQARRQYYTDSTDTVTVPLNVDVEDIDDIRVKLYVAVMNGEYDSGPLALPGSDHLLLQYRVSHGKLHLEKIECSPKDYPSFAY